MLAHISANTLIWLSLFGPMLVIAGLAFTIAHVVEVLFPSFGEEA